MHTPENKIENPMHGTFKTYLAGFLLSIVLTLLAYYLVEQHLLRGWTLITAIMGLGVIQALIQLIFFLDLGRESKPRMNMHVFLFMLLILVVIVWGTLWIMNNLDERVMPPMESIMRQETLQKQA